MTVEMAIVFAVLGSAVVLLLSERIGTDVMALMVLLALVVTGVLSAEDALSGFGDPVVITVWAMFILSAALARTGVAAVIGRRILRFSRGGEAGLIGVIMLTAAVLSALINNVAVVALMLPVVMDVARRRRVPASRLLMPLTFATLHGSLFTGWSTPPNLVVSAALVDQGLAPFGMFEFTPVGVVIVAVGVAVMVLWSRHLLPRRVLGASMGSVDGNTSAARFGLRDEQFALRLRPGSGLVGRTLAGSRLGAALGVNVVAVLRGGRIQLAPTPDTVLEAEDRLVVEGSPERLERLRSHRQFRLVDTVDPLQALLDGGAAFAELEVAETGGLAGRSLRDLTFRQRYGIQLLGVTRGGARWLADYEDIPLAVGDRLLVVGTPGRIASASAGTEYRGIRVLVPAEVRALGELGSALRALRVEPHSPLAGQSLAGSRLGDALGIGVLAVARDGEVILLPEPSHKLAVDDVLVVKVRAGTLDVLAALSELTADIDVPSEAGELESEDVGLVEVVLSPYSRLVGRSLRDLHFRDKYGLNVVAIWRAGRALRAELRDVPLRLGDALLLHGRWDRLKVLAGEPDFLVLTQSVQEPPRRERAPLAVAIMLFVVIVPAVMGWLPIAISALLGATLVVLLGCLTMDEAYRSIEWRAVFLMAGMMSLGLAMDQTGAAAYVADLVVAAIGPYGPLAVLAAVLLLATAAAQVMPSVAVAVLLAPIGIRAALGLDVSPYTFAMAVAVGAAAGLMSPMGHPINTMVMGPGGYRIGDFIRVGAPVTAAVTIAGLLVLPWLWPLMP